MCDNIRVNQGKKLACERMPNVTSTSTRIMVRLGGNLAWIGTFLIDFSQQWMISDILNLGQRHSMHLWTIHKLQKILLHLFPPSQPSQPFLVFAKCLTYFFLELPRLAGHTCLGSQNVREGTRGTCRALGCSFCTGVPPFRTGDTGGLASLWLILSWLAGSTGGSCRFVIECSRSAGFAGNCSC